MQPPELFIAMFADDTPPRGWPDPAKVIRQINVLSPATLDAAMGNQAQTKRRVQNQVAAAAPGAPIYLDIEPGQAGWARADVRAFAIDLLLTYPACRLFPGSGAFDALIQSNPAAAIQVASAATGGVLFPAYHSALSIAQHERVLRSRLDRLAALGIPFAIAVSRIYNDAVGPALARTRIPVADFLRGVELCRSYSRTIVLWSWGRDWAPRGEDELRTAMTAGDQDLVVFSVC